MAETPPTTSDAPSAPRKTGVLGWLFHPQQKRFLLPATGGLILALDWLLFSSNAISGMLATPLVMILGFVLGSTGTYLIQTRYGGDSRSRAALKALLAGIVVGLPWPLGGTLIGGWVLLTSGLGNAKQDALDR